MSKHQHGSGERERTTRCWAAEPHRSPVYVWVCTKALRQDGRPHKGRHSWEEQPNHPGYSSKKVRLFDWQVEVMRRIEQIGSGWTPSVDIDVEEMLHER